MIRNSAGGQWTKRKAKRIDRGQRKDLVGNMSKERRIKEIRGDEIR